MDFQQDIDQCLKTLSEGGLILYPTDTIWGIGCDATNQEAVQKVYALKQRADEKALIVLLADERDVLQYVAGADLSVFDYLQQTTKPTTVIYDGAIGLADNLIGADGSIAIRLCQEPFCRHLLKRFRKPIVSTSANISGQPSAPFFKQVSDEIKSGVDYVVQYRQEDETIAVPSAIIKWENGRVQVIRP
ncbi:threonylcarbamoyl-AMP synthase [Terrimonas sp. NA20]|uniref:L-threonylcarbamoyladenylate synthase n=1 Tax=Terrimonas ginsenosidimutans TaxID=2908004 RepID=A0ABS9KTU8_9BACT|nr:L-threonylcarbamoyladenylate synthase [Terrimonas ginsenosidimutans]MCG2615703.1 threonylcarbamoyl-AMP synthase [Terrimonas ginsenosidimutans]